MTPAHSSDESSRFARARFSAARCSVHRLCEKAGDARLFFFMRFFKFRIKICRVYIERAHDAGGFARKHRAVEVADKIRIEHGIQLEHAFDLSAAVIGNGIARYYKHIAHPLQGKAEKERFGSVEVPVPAGEMRKSLDPVLAFQHSGEHTAVRTGAPDRTVGHCDIVCSRRFDFLCRFHKKRTSPASSGGIKFHRHWLAPEGPRGFFPAGDMDFRFRTCRGGGMVRLCKGLFCRAYMRKGGPAAPAEDARARPAGFSAAGPRIEPACF